MPEISRFLGIVIGMFYRDHEPDDFLASSDGLLAALTARNIDPEVTAPHRDELQAAAKAIKSVMGDRLSLAISRLHDGFDRLIFHRVEAVIAARLCLGLRMIKGSVVR